MIIVGLGNPGEKYEKTHHNAGFIAVDYIAEQLGVKFKEKGCQAIYGTTSYNNERIIIAKPQTYMNLSGESVKMLSKSYSETPDNILIIYDDIELPIGTIRIRKEGSGGTHNGMKNIIQELNTTSIPRVRIGLGVDKTMELKDFVLSKISKNDMQIVNAACEKIYNSLLQYIKDKNFDRLMQNCNGQV